MPSQQQTSTTPEPLRDQWQTPPFIADWIGEKFPMVRIDLAATEENRLFEFFIDQEQDSLNTDWLQMSWRGVTWGFFNPPYSKPSVWLEKAWEEAQRGFCSIALLPTPNGETYYQDFVFGKASEIIFINGRLAFHQPVGNGKTKAVSGNTRGSCLIVFGRAFEGPTAMSWVNRDDIKAEYDARLQDAANG